MEKKHFLAILIMSIIILVSFFFLLNYQDNYQETQNDFFVDFFEVSDENDDSRTFTVELSPKGYENENGNWPLQLSPSYSFGVRFTNVSIPKDAKILQVYVELYSIGTPGHSHPNCKIFCDNSDNASNFSIIGVLDISGRNYTSNFTLWNSTVPYGEWVKSPDLTAQLKEVMSRENWTSGNSIAILFVTEEIRGYSAAFKNYESNFPAKLYIKWEN